MRNTAVGIGGELRRGRRQRPLDPFRIEAVAAGRRAPVPFGVGRPLGRIGEDVGHSLWIGARERELAHRLEHFRRAVQARKTADERQFLRTERGRSGRGRARARPAVVRAAGAPGIEGGRGERRATEGRGRSRRRRIRICPAHDVVELERHRFAEGGGKAAHPGGRLPARGAEGHEVELEHGRDAGRRRGDLGGGASGGRLGAMRRALPETLGSGGESMAHGRGVTGGAGGIGDVPPNRAPVGEAGVDAPRPVAALALHAGERGTREVGSKAPDLTGAGRVAADAIGGGFLAGAHEAVEGLGMRRRRPVGGDRPMTAGARTRADIAGPARDGILGVAGAGGGCDGEEKRDAARQDAPQSGPEPIAGCVRRHAAAERPPVRRGDYWQQR